MFWAVPIGLVVVVWGTYGIMRLAEHYRAWPGRPDGWYEDRRRPQHFTVWHPVYDWAEDEEWGE